MRRKPESVLIAGSSGQLGPCVVRAFVEAGFRVFALQRSSREIAGAEVICLPSDWTEANLREATGALNIEAVVNLVGAGVDPGSRQLDLLQAVNVELTASLASLAQKLNARAFVNIGSGSEYLPSDDGYIDELAPLNTSDLYATTKAEGGRRSLDFCAAHDIASAHMRLFGMYGESERSHRLLPTIVRSFHSGTRAKLSGGFQTRDWLYERDIGRAIEHLTGSLLAGKAPSGVYNLGSGKGHTVRSFAELAANVLGAGPDFLEFGAIGLRIGEGNRLVANTSKINNVTGWYPLDDLHSGISKAIEKMPC